MARLARVVIPGVAHHVTQRGNRRQPIFFSDDDRRTYLALLHQGCEKAGVRCLAWCLMDNHVHLILVPEHADGLRAALGEAHRRYTSHVNARQGWSGYLFQGRFASYPMDDAHLMTAVRYVELNPVVAGLVPHAEDWPWSSARSHIAGKRAAGDALTDVAALGEHVANWRAMLRHGQRRAISTRRSRRGCVPAAPSATRHGSVAPKPRSHVPSDRPNAARSSKRHPLISIMSPNYSAWPTAP
ncbi:MAG: hypothetical protein JWL96_1355 [Sphingomonas bacterium]|uniref:transposase n=1 Tax=Sphingomonas bacterium TaxID=1895847 RepID=UPI00260E1F5D|nr:transposase [Sphingomonas bacterium]MDB5709285.1 hypothetical protein [Sphingomonas bacterium]